MRDHLPECPAPLCDWGDPSAECMGYEDCHHLPECSYTSGIWYSLDEPCICPQLRACEERVRDNLFALRSRLARQLETARVNGWHAGWNAALEDGYAAGLNAARKAASTQRSKFKARDWDDAIEAALAAIDALQGDP